MVDNGDLQLAPPREYEGLPGRTRQLAAHYTCPSCGFLFGAQLYSTVNVATDGQLSDLLSKGDLNILTCPACAAIYSANVPLIYHDPKARRFALLLPESMRHRELEERARLLEELAADPSHIPDYVKRAEVVFGTTGLLRLLDETLEALTPKEPRSDEQQRLKESLEERRVEIERREAEIQAREEDLQAQQEDLVTARAKLEEEQVHLAMRWTELERERQAASALAVDLQARERTLEERARALVERLRAADKEKEKERAKPPADKVAALKSMVERVAALKPPAEKPSPRTDRPADPTAGTLQQVAALMPEKPASGSERLAPEPALEGPGPEKPARETLAPEGVASPTPAAPTPAAPTPAAAKRAEEASPGEEAKPTEAAKPAAEAKPEAAKPEEATPAAATPGAEAKPEAATPAEERPVVPEAAPVAEAPPASALLLEGRPQTDVDRWRASEERTAQLAHEGHVFLLAKPGWELLPTFRDVEPTLLVQLRAMPASPLVVLVVIPAAAEDRAAKAIYFSLDPGAAADQAVLAKLGEECVLQLDLYDDEARAVGTWEIQAPLTENVRLLIKRSAELLAKIDGPRTFPEAVKAFAEMGDERLGRKQHNFSADSFQDLPTPAAARLALGIVSYWSEPENQDYLLLVKSFPVIYWRRIRDRVVRRSLEFGLRMASPLVEFAVEHKIIGSTAELLRASVANFAEVSLRIKASDLDPRQEWENWKLLLADCVREKVEVDAEMEELASAVARRAGVDEREAGPGGDLSQLDEAMLLPLLEDRELRCDAALELCDRGTATAVEGLYRAVCNMTRTEVARVIPAMIHLGGAALPSFLQGMKHRKSFIRQGCALALGAMKAEAGLEPLMDMLLGEPTNVWREAARALGDMGSLALGALIAGVKSADANGRERIAWALSQSALEPKSRQEVEAMTRSRDTRLAKVANRALELLDQVRQNDAEVRGGKPLREQTIVRSFSRRFFEYMSADVSELGEGDIVEQEEILDDKYIVDEEVEVTDDDILNR
jgi:hypothetical protein